MICPTTTPFEIQDIVSILSKPRKQIETAWKILRPHFGTQLSFGCGRVVEAPNFFDIIAMSVLTEILNTPQGIEELTITSIEVAEEIATVMDQSEFECLFGKRQADLVFAHLISSFKGGDFQSGIKLDVIKFLAIARVVSDIFTRVQRSLENREAIEPHNIKRMSNLKTRIA